jgi:DNA-directed RNA polymerase subunit RPC12/RpoP
MMMENGQWHAAFNPQKFLARIDVNKLIEHNEAYNENRVDRLPTPCILCSGLSNPGLLLNDKSYLCKECFSLTSTIAYPEKYERLRRQHISEIEARRVAREAFCKQHEYVKSVNPVTVFAWLSLLLLFVFIGFAVLTAILFFVSSSIEKEQNKKIEAWRKQLQEWKSSYPEPSPPTLRHFHDPLAELSSRDRIILKIFNNWPGYPPFWGYLRAVVIARDGNRCQVTGCPSRLSLHVHHRLAVSQGGEHIPANLVSLCDFHHALEPDDGHERIWGNVKTRYFTLVREHVRHNRNSDCLHEVNSHLRRLELISLNELKSLHSLYGYSCSNCKSLGIKFTLHSDKNKLTVVCNDCGTGWEGPQQLTEEVGPKLAEVLAPTKNIGVWKPRWDMLENRKAAAFKSFTSNPSKMKEQQKRGRASATSAANISTITPRSCPRCGNPMRLVKPRPGQRWEAFWGCSQYRITGCRGR